MSETRTPPHNLTAEEAVLGAMLLSSSVVEEVSAEVSVADFYKPAHRRIFDAIVRLWAAGQPHDVVSVGNLLEREGQPEPLGMLQLAPASMSAAPHYAGIVAEHATRCRMIEILEAFVVRAFDGGEEAGDLLDALKAELAALDVCASAAMPGDAYTLEDFDALPAENAPWVIPGMLRTSWRVVMVAEEGKGKSYLSRQFAVCVSAGLHPLSFRPIEPRPVVIVDLENPQDVVQGHLRSLRATASARSQVSAPAHLWHRPGGLDLRTRKDRGEFVALLNRTRPALVCLGPIYKSYRVKAKESDEQVAAEVQAILDDLRTRFGFALLLAHHAPHGESASSRNLRPFGSSLWLRWPEFGLALRQNRETPSSLDVGRWRGDRVQPNGWPDRLDRQKQGFPWAGYWRDGVQESW